MKALISVYDKRGVVDFARSLGQSGVELISTGGTYDALTRAGLPVKQVSEVTHFPEILDGRVKTLHPAIHGGILARRDIPEHMTLLTTLGINTIDIVAVNLYPFEATISKSGVSLEEALENIDIGGPTMVRAAAKNFPFVIVVVDPEDYSWLTGKIADGTLTTEERRHLAAKAFQHVALYDTIVAGYLREQQEALFPEQITLGFRKLQELRYGENPHQKGALYSTVPASAGITAAHQLHGKELSFNNILDADAAWGSVREFGEPTVAVIKHTNPCGLASHPDLAEAYRRAFQGDPVSAFGGIVSFNRTLTLDAAEEMRKTFYEIVIAPDYAPEALELLGKKRDLRVLAVKAEDHQRALELRQVSGGLLLQTGDAIQEDTSSWKVVTERKPTRKEMEDLAFGWKVVKHIKSNAIVLAKDKALMGMGAGQPNRVTSVHLALRIAGEKAHGSVLASDAFFPFPDGVELAAQGGVTAIAEPGGSIRDDEVISTANKYNLAMVFTSVRHFRH